MRSTVTFRGVTFRRVTASWTASGKSLPMVPALHTAPCGHINLSHKYVIHTPWAHDRLLHVCLNTGSEHLLVLPRRLLGSSASECPLARRLVIAAQQLSRGSPQSSSPFTPMLARLLYTCSDH